MNSLSKSLVKVRFDADSLSHVNSEQLKFGLAALICAHRRLRGYIDYSKTSEQEWHLFLEKVDFFIDEQRLNKRFKARKYLNLAMFSLINFNILQCVRNLSEAFGNDKLFFLKRGIGIRAPNDIKEFLV